MLHCYPRQAMKLIVQIPCYNEEETLSEVIRAIPTRIDGISSIEIQVIDDGSTDRTIEVALAHSVRHIIANKSNRGLARTFQKGIANALAEGADIIVNTDGDHQYPGYHIPALIRPIIEGRADVVVGDRSPGQNLDFHPVKRLLQRLGSAVVRKLAGVDVADAVSGFRAYSREAALKMTVMTNFSYTTETLIHAGQNGLTVVSVPITTNPVNRPSRLFGSVTGFVRKQVISILRSCFMYRSLSAFATLGFFLLVIGVLPVLRFIYFYILGNGDGKIQSLVVGSLCIGLGYVTIVIAFLSDAVATNRRLLEESLERLRKMDSK